jgi:hypothetical protein
MNPRRIIGLILSGGGVLLSVAGGLWLAFTSSDLGAAFVNGLLLLAPISALVIGGIYLYVTGEDRSADLIPSSTLLQRHLTDQLAAGTPQHFTTLASTLETTPDQIADLLRDLIEQGLFNGYVDWAAGEARQLASMGADCARCGARLTEKACERCGAQYHLIN